MTQLVLIDGNNIGYAGMYIPALAHLSCDDHPTGGILGMAQSVVRISNLYPQAIPVVLWDGHAAWRKALYPEYKGNRHDTPEKMAVAESWNEQQAHARLLLMHMGVIQVRAIDAEADDLVWRICQGVEDPDFGIERVVLCSNDQDWLQALGPRVDWYSPITEKTMNLDTFLHGDDAYRSTEEFILAKAMAGDKSDNIDGVPGVGMKTAVKLLRLYGGLDGIAAAVASGTAKDKRSADIATSLPLIARNRKLMDWSLSEYSGPSATSILREPFYAEEVRRVCERFRLDSLMRRLAPDSDFIRNSEAWDIPTSMDFLEKYAPVTQVGWKDDGYAV